jgi:hypothetical protein
LGRRTGTNVVLVVVAVWGSGVVEEDGVEEWGVPLVEVD